MISTNYYQERYKDLLIVGVDGDAQHISRCLDVYRERGRFKDLDISPIVQNTTLGGVVFNSVFANMYEPDVFTFQICQDIGDGDQLHTSLVCTGIGNSTLDVLVDFAEVVSFRERNLTPGFIVSLADQNDFKMIYDQALEYRLDPKLLLATSLRENQRRYRESR